MKPRALPDRAPDRTRTPIREPHARSGPSRGKWRATIAGIFSTLCLVAALGAAESRAAESRAAEPGTPAALPGYDHVVVVVFENKQYGQIIGSAPYINQLANAGASLTGMKALTHPGRPNYFNPAVIT